MNKKTPRRHYLVMYDITHGSTLQKVAKLVEKQGFERINYSVWIGWHNPSRDIPFRTKLRELLKHEAAKGSRFYVLPHTASSLEKLRSISGHKPTELDYWLGKRPWLFF